MNSRGLIAVAGLALFVSALALVWTQYRARALFVDLDSAQQQGRALAAEGVRLRAELGSLSQPALVATAARNLGLAPIDAAHTEVLAGRAGGAVAVAPEAKP